jgi:hypothetical protein
VQGGFDPIIPERLHQLVFEPPNFPNEAGHSIEVFGSTAGEPFRTIGRGQEACSNIPKGLSIVR